MLDGVLQDVVQRPALVLASRQSRAPSEQGSVQMPARAVGGSGVGVGRPRSQGLVSPKFSAGCSGCLAAAARLAAMEADHQGQSLLTHTSQRFARDTQGHL